MQLDFFEQDDEPEITPSYEGVQTKVCKGCGVEKPVEGNFAKQVTTGKGKQFYDSRCRPCASKRSISQKRIRRAAPPVSSNCECCGVDFATFNSKNIHMDHCDVTSKFRGWLCRNCNLGIGFLGDTTQGVTDALAYLRRFDERS